MQDYDSWWPKNAPPENQLLDFQQHLFIFIYPYLKDDTKLREGVKSKYQWIHAYLLRENAKKMDMRDFEVKWNKRTEKLWEFVNWKFASIWFRGIKKRTWDTPTNLWEIDGKMRESLSEEEWCILFKLVKEAYEATKHHPHWHQLCSGIGNLCVWAQVPMLIPTTEPRESISGLRYFMSKRMAVREEKLMAEVKRLEEEKAKSDRAMTCLVMRRIIENITHNSKKPQPKRKRPETQRWLELWKDAWARKRAMDSRTDHGEPAHPFAEFGEGCQATFANKIEVYGGEFLYNKLSGNIHNPIMKMRIRADQWDEMQKEIFRVIIPKAAIEGDEVDVELLDKCDWEEFARQLDGYGPDGKLMEI